VKGCGRDANDLAPPRTDPAVRKSCTGLLPQAEMAFQLGAVSKGEASHRSFGRLSLSACVRLYGWTAQGKYLTPAISLEPEFIMRGKGFDRSLTAHSACTMPLNVMINDPANPIFLSGFPNSFNPNQVKCRGGAPSPPARWATTPGCPYNLFAITRTIGIFRNYFVYPEPDKLL